MDEKTIELLCEKFHTTVDNLMPVYSQYAMTKDIVSGIICLLIIIICAVITILMVKRGIEKEYYEEFMDFIPCPKCGGRRLSREVLAVTVGDEE